MTEAQKSELVILRKKIEVLFQTNHALKVLHLSKTVRQICSGLASCIKWKYK